MTKRLRAAGEGGGVKKLNMETEKNTVANLLLLLSHGVARTRKHIDHERRTFECKTCNKQFPSFQALGGHCTTHKRPAPAGEPGAQSAARATKKASRRKTHQCAVCGMEFGMGQALGGHMRRHKFTTEDLLRSLDDEQGLRRAGEANMLLQLDLNLPPPPEDHDLNLEDLFFGVGPFEEATLIC